MIFAYANGASQCSPVQKDYQRVVNYDDEGNEFITYVEVDYPALQESHGTVEMWSLDALMKAGINPDFGIHTGFNTRLEGVGVIDDASAYVEQMFADADAEKKDE